MATDADLAGLAEMVEPDDPRVEVYRNLKERDLAGRGDLFILEGEDPGTVANGTRLARSVGRHAPRSVTPDFALPSTSLRKYSPPPASSTRSPPCRLPCSQLRDAAGQPPLSAATPYVAFECTLLPTRQPRPSSCTNTPASPPSRSMFSSRSGCAPVHELEV